MMEEVITSLSPPQSDFETHPLKQINVSLDWLLLPGMKSQANLDREGGDGTGGGQEVERHFIIVRDTYT